MALMKVRRDRYSIQSQTSVFTEIRERNEHIEAEFALFKSECFYELHGAERLDMATTYVQQRLKQFIEVCQSEEKKIDMNSFRSERPEC